MKRYFLLVLVITCVLNGAAEGDVKAASKKGEITWQQLLDNYYGPQQKTDADLKKGMNEQLLSDLVYASVDPTRQGEARMMIEIINRRVNAHNSPQLTKNMIAAMLIKFKQQAPDALESAEKVRDAMTITDPELSRTKEVLKKVAFTLLLNDTFQKMVAPHFPECTGIPCDASSEALEEKVKADKITEDQIVHCMHSHTLAKLLAFCLIQSHQF